MDHKEIRNKVIAELDIITSMTILAGSWEEWRNIGTKLCNLDTLIDKHINPDLYETVNDLPPNL